MSSAILRKRKYIFIKDDSFTYVYKKEVHKMSFLKCIKNALKPGSRKWEARPRMTPLPKHTLQYLPEISYYCNLFEPVSRNLLIELEEEDGTFFEENEGDEKSYLTMVETAEETHRGNSYTVTRSCDPKETFNENNSALIQNKDLQSVKYSGKNLNLLASAGEDVYMQTEIMNKIREFDQNSQKEKWGKLFERCSFYCQPNCPITESSTTIVNLSNNNENQCEQDGGDKPFAKEENVPEMEDEHRSIRFAAGCEKMIFDKNESCESFKDSVKLFMSNKQAQESIKLHPKSCLKKRENVNYTVESLRAKGCDLVEVEEFERLADRYDEEKSTLQRTFSCYRLRQVSTYHLMNDDLRKNSGHITEETGNLDNTFLGYKEEENEP